MKEKRDDDDANTVSELAKTIGLPYPVRLSDELSELLKPNEFLTGLGIRHDDRINSVLSSLKGSLIPKSSSLKETVPKDGVVFSMPLVQGPFIKEKIISVKAEMTDDGGKGGILLTAVLETE